MSFYGLWPRSDYAGYWPEKFGISISETRIPEESRRAEIQIAEYLGDPPRKPGKRGSFHKSAYGYFVREDAIGVFERAAQGLLSRSTTVVLARESESFFQVWVTNFVDCLDEKNSTISPVVSKSRGKIGVIKRPAFDESRWDGSGLFVLPQDPNYTIYCAESFVERCKESRIKGVEFRRHIMDTQPIRC